jgi:hypothetical protein
MLILKGLVFEPGLTDGEALPALDSHFCLHPSPFAVAIMRHGTQVGEKSLFAPSEQVLSANAY